MKYSLRNILLGIKKYWGRIVNPGQLGSKFSDCCSYFLPQKTEGKGKRSLLKGVFFNKPSCWQIKWQAPLSPADSLAGSLLTCVGQTDWFNWQSCKNLQRLMLNESFPSAIFSSLNAAMQPKALKTVLFIVGNQSTSDYFHFYFLKLCFSLKAII